MKNNKLIKIIKSICAVVGVATSGLLIWTKISEKKRKKDEDLSKDTYVGAGVPVQTVRKTFYEKYMKRFIDIVISIMGIVVLFPVFIVTATAIFITDPGPVIFTQKRVGINKTFFKLYKFRSMKMSTPHDVPTHMLDNPESYITTVGKFIRKTSIDELPQLFNILEGNLSVVGPRPALWNQEDLVAERDKYCANDVMPGLTGWAQINGRDELEIPVKAKMDGEYVERLRKNIFSGIVIDTKCFFGTIISVLKSDGVVEGGTGEMKKNARYDIPDVNTRIGFGEEVFVDLSQKKKVLITGANSYIGESFEKYAKEHYAANFEIDTVDMIDGSWREKDFSDYDTVFHVAGIAHADVGKVSEEVKDKYYAVNTDLAIETAEKAKKEGVKQFVFMSSMIVYGESAPYGKQKMITAETEPEPANFYGDSKWQADKGVRALATEDFNVLVLRPPMIYGKGSKGNYPTLAKLAKKLPVFPDVNNQRSMLYIENLCEFLCQVMLVGKGELFFPQNAEYTKTADMVKDISEVVGKKIWITKILNPFVWMGSKVPGKIGGLVNKAFGNSCYDMMMSNYAGINYRVNELKHSIYISERGDVCMQNKKIAIISSQYFWLPEEAGPSRFYSIARIFKDNGYDVDVFTSSFEHHEKKQRNRTILTDLNVTYIDCPSYKKNIDLRRELSNIIFERKLLQIIKDKILEYDAVYCSIPPNNMWRIGKLCKKNKVAFVVDVEDLWPEAMLTVFNKAFQFLFLPYKIDAEMTYKYADGVVGTSEEYTARAWENNHRSIPNKTVYVGSDIEQFDDEVSDNIDEVNKTDNEFWVIYAGSIGHSYAIDNIVRTSKLVGDYRNIKFLILGDGPMRSECERLAEELGCNNISFLGYVSHPIMSAYLSKADVTINSFAKGAAQSIVNKIGDYLAAGKPMINTLENKECCALIEDNKVGINVPAENPEELAKAIISLYSGDESCICMGTNARKLAEKRFDRKTAYRDIVELVESL